MLFIAAFLLTYLSDGGEAFPELVIFSQPLSYAKALISLLPVIIFHTLLNSQIFPTWNTAMSAMFFVIIWTLVTITVIFVWGPRRLVRHRTDFTNHLKPVKRIKPEQNDKVQ